MLSNSHKDRRNFGLCVMIWGFESERLFECFDCITKFPTKGGGHVIRTQLDIRLLMKEIL